MAVLDGQVKDELVVADDLQRRLAEGCAEQKVLGARDLRRGLLAQVVVLRQSTGVLAFLPVLRLEVGVLAGLLGAVVGVLP